MRVRGAGGEEGVAGRGPPEPGLCSQLLPCTEAACPTAQPQTELPGIRPRLRVGFSPRTGCSPLTSARPFPQAHIRFKPTLSQQQDTAVDGNLIVRYDVNRTLSGGSIQVRGLPARAGPPGRPSVLQSLSLRVLEGKHNDCSCSSAWSRDSAGRKPSVQLPCPSPLCSRSGRQGFPPCLGSVLPSITAASFAEVSSNIVQPLYSFDGPCVFWSLHSFDGSQGYYV